VAQELFLSYREHFICCQSDEEYEREATGETDPKIVAQWRLDRVESVDFKIHVFSPSID
jgi:hypothetical protein